jgi:Protein of unknown function (DUF3105)
MRRGRKALLLGGVPLLLVGTGVALALTRDDVSGGCRLEELREQAGGHVAGLPPGFAYNSFPPTSGPSGDTPLVWREYRRPVSQFRLVHNLLHGGIAVQYGPEVDPGPVRAWYQADPDGIVVAPLPRLGDRIALSAWRNLATCTGFRPRDFTAFRARHRFNGPERPPRETMRPGRGGRPNPLGLRVTPTPVRGAATLSFLYAEAATVDVTIRAGSARGPAVRRLATISTVPSASVRLEWNRRDDAGRRVPAGIYVAVATVRSDARRVTSVSVFEVG